MRGGEEKVGREKAGGIVAFVVCVIVYWETQESDDVEWRR